MSWLNGSVKTTRKNFRSIRGKDRKDIPFTTFLGNSLVLATGAFLCYASVHYVGAFVNIGKAFQSSTNSASLSVKPRSEVEHVMATVRKNVKYTKVFLRKNQAVEAEFVLPDGARLDLHVLQCQQFPVIEVFRCNPVSEQTVTITNKKRGASTIFVADAGFYYFTETVTVSGADAAGRNKDYALVWRRA